MPTEEVYVNVGDKQSPSFVGLLALSFHRSLAMVEWSSFPIDVKCLCERRNLLPVLARIAPDEDDGDQVVEEGESQPPAGPFYLLYSVRRCFKVMGTRLRWEEEKRQLINANTNYVVPVNYPGWFQILPNEAVQPLIPLLSIEAVVSSKTATFLVHSPITGYWPSESPGLDGISKGATFQKFQVLAGEVLTCGSIFVEPTDDSKQNNCCCIWSRKKAAAENERMYLQCRGTHGNNILIPLETQGQFSCIGNNFSNPSKDCETSEVPFVYQMSDLIKRQDFPQDVQLVYGMPPATFANELPFNGMLKLGEKYYERSLIACQITGDRLAFLEFPSDSGVEFLIARNWEAVKEEPSFIKARSFCQKNLEAYKLEIQLVLDNIPNYVQRRSSKENLLDIPQAFGSGTLCRGNFSKLSLKKAALQQEGTLPSIQGASINSQADSSNTQLKHHNMTAVDEENYPHTDDETASRDEFISSSTQRKNEEEQRAVILNPSTLVTKFLDRELLRKSGNTHELQVHEQEILRKKLTRVKPEDNMFYYDEDIMTPPSNASKRLSTISFGSSQMRDRELPPVPPKTKTHHPLASITNVQRISSEKESVTSDPDMIYERIPHESQPQKIVSNEPSASAPSSPAPRLKPKTNDLINNGKGVELLSAYDPNGYLIPVECREPSQSLETGKCQKIGLKTSDKKQGNGTIEKTQKMNYPTKDAIPTEYPYDSERLQSFLNDSVAEFYRKQAFQMDTDETPSGTGKGDRRFRKNHLPETIFSRSRLRPMSWHEMAQGREDRDAYLDMILDCGDADTEDESSIRFVRQTTSTSLQGRRYRPAGIVSHQAYDSMTHSDSGIASRQSTLKREYKDWTYWSASDFSWEPPKDLSSLTVEEVALSLRYIGMKDQIVASFSKEQVDGKFFCEMNSHLLKEGFPNMNSLERKKVLDFIQGWRPKRMLFYSDC